MSGEGQIGAGGIVTAALLVIGDEILSGRTKDKNIGHIADHLTAIGIQLKEVRVVPDEEGEIVGAVNALRAKYTYLFTDMRQEGWGIPQKAFDAAHIYDVEFQTSEATPFDFWIDDLAFVKK